MADQQELTTVSHQRLLELGFETLATCAKQGKPIALEIYFAGFAVLQAAAPGATADNIAWAVRKRNVVVRFQKSSLEIKQMCEAGGFDLNEGFRLPRETFVASGGSVPILVRDLGVVGAISISGLTDTEDHALAVAMLDRLAAPA